MKKLLIILLSSLSLTAFAQDKKTVAVLDPICRDNSVNMFYQQMVRGAMESAVTASTEYEAYNRSAFDQIQKEQSLQRTGAVNDSQIKKMGEMAGVDYVLVSEVSAFDGYLSTVVKILNVTTGKYDKIADDYTQLNPESVTTTCREMASSMFGGQSWGSSSHSSFSNKVALPNWFMHPKGGTFVGISVPGGSAQDAVSLALLQYLLAHDLPCSHTPESATSSWTEDDSNHMEFVSRYSFQVTDFIAGFQIVSVQLLPTGEYICQIAAGDKRNSPLTVKFTLSSYGKTVGENTETSTEIAFKMTDGIYNSSYFFKSSEENGAYQEKMEFSSTDNSGYRTSKSYSLALNLLNDYIFKLVTDFTDTTGSETASQVRKATPVKGFYWMEDTLMVEY